MFSLLTMLSISLSGCTLIGAGVGADIDSMIPGPYEEHPPTELMQLERNERVVVRLRNGACVSGHYLGTHGPTPADLERYLLVTAEEKVVSVKSSEIAAIDVEVTGKGWLYGGLVGLAVDATVVVVSAIALHDIQYNWSKDPHG